MLVSSSISYGLLTLTFVLAEILIVLIALD